MIQHSRAAEDLRFLTRNEPFESVTGVELFCVEELLSLWPKDNEARK